MLINRTVRAVNAQSRCRPAGECTRRDVILKGLALKSLSAAGVSGGGWVVWGWAGAGFAYLPAAASFSAFASHKAYLTAGFVGQERERERSELRCETCES